MHHHSLIGRCLRWRGVCCVWVAALLLFSACSSPADRGERRTARPQTVHPSEARLTDYQKQVERVRVYAARSAPEASLSAFVDGWNSVQEEQAFSLNIDKSRALQGWTAPAMDQTGSWTYLIERTKVQPQLKIRVQLSTDRQNRQHIRQIEVSGQPDTNEQRFPLMNGWATAIAVHHVLQRSALHSFDAVNRTFKRLGIKPNADLQAIKTADNGCRTLKEPIAEVRACYLGGSYRLEIAYSAPLILPTSSTDGVQVQSQTRRTNLSYLYFGNPAGYASQIDKTGNTLTTVSPNYFDITADGQLDITWKLDSSFIAEMKRRGIKVVPFLSNHWQREPGILALQNAETLSTQIAEAVERYQLDGVNVDIEGVGATYRAAFSQFVRTLRSKLPAGKELSVAVAANPNGWQTGWHGFYDYRALADVADYLMIMSYDESWEGSEPGPVSSLGFFQRSLQYARSQGLTLNQIVMGVPFYGRLWKTSGSDAASIRGIGVSNSRLAALVQAYGGSFGYDQQKQSPYFMFEIGTGQGQYIAGKWCDAGQYILWYEDEQSIKQKLRVVAKEGVRGAGSWSLYQEAAGTWDYFSLWLNGQPFRDVADQHWAFDAILRVSERGWMSGVSTLEFAPQQTLTRAQGAVILARAVGLTAGSYPPGDGQSPFADVAPDHWGFEWIKAAYLRELVRGTGITAGGMVRFEPEKPLTREQLSVLLTRLLQTGSGASDSGLNDSQVAREPLTSWPFLDVAADRWSFPAISYMYGQGVIGGMAANRFAPEAVSTRAQMAALMERLSGRLITMGID